MKLSLRSKLTISYISIVVIFIVTLIFVVNFSLENHFRKYIIENNENKHKQAVKLIQQEFEINNYWIDSNLEVIGVNLIEQGLITKVKDLEGNMIWDATAHNNGMCKEILSRISSNMSKRYPNWKAEYIEKRYDVIVNGNVVGYVDVGYYGPYYLTDSDLAFISTINNIIFIVGFSLIVIALLFAIFMSKRISKPIVNVIDIAKNISIGNFSYRSTNKVNIKEIDNLSETINTLGQTLEKQEELRKKLTADMAHELRTPLSTLQGSLEGMLDGIWEPDENRLKSCLEEILRINRMVGDLEKLAEYDHENIILNYSQFDIFELTKNIVTNFEKDALKKNIQVDISGENILLNADKDKISQVLVNLISNSIKYTLINGQININVDKDSDFIKIKVADTGIGVSSEDLPNIFERLYRADKSRNRNTGGAGIGLTITKAIVDSHNGKIMVSSEIDKGTTFEIFLPIK